MGNGQFENGQSFALRKGLAFYRSYKFCSPAGEQELLSSVALGDLGIALSDRSSRRGSPILTSKFIKPTHTLNALWITKLCRFLYRRPNVN